MRRWGPSSRQPWPPWGGDMLAPAVPARQGCAFFLYSVCCMLYSGQLGLLHPCTLALPGCNSATWPSAAAAAPGDAHLPAACSACSFSLLVLVAAPAATTCSSTLAAPSVKPPCSCPPAASSMSAAAAAAASASTSVPSCQLLPLSPCQPASASASLALCLPPPASPAAAAAASSAAAASAAAPQPGSTTQSPPPRCCCHCPAQPPQACGGPCQLAPLLGSALSCTAEAWARGCPCRLCLRPRLPRCRLCPRPAAPQQGQQAGGSDEGCAAQRQRAGQLFEHQGIGQQGPQEGEIVEGGSRGGAALAQAGGEGELQGAGGGQGRAGQESGGLGRGQPGMVLFR